MTAFLGGALRKGRGRRGLQPGERCRAPPTPSDPAAPAPGGPQIQGPTVQYFETTATRFASIYTSPRLIDRIFRRDMYDRFRRTLEECHPLHGKSVLDVGCGSGQYATALATRGAGEVVGLDFATNMLCIATDNTRQAGVAHRTRFVVGDFLTHPFGRRFDYVIAVGFFDYIAEPLPFLRRAQEVTQDKFVATFPRLLTWRAAVRTLRLRFAGCPVYFYTRRRVGN